MQQSNRRAKVAHVVELYRKSFLPIVMTFFVIFMEMMLLDFQIYGAGDREPQYIDLNMFIVYYLLLAPLVFFMVLYAFNRFVLRFTLRETMLLNAVLFTILEGLMVLGYYKLNVWKIPLFT
jgi:hypothetical protein